LTLTDYTINDDSFYLFACAELKAREKEFIEEQKIKRMIGVKSANDFLRMLHETYYLKYLTAAGANDNFENVIISELKSMVSFLRDRLKAEHQIIINLLTLKEDLHNVKLMMKSAFLDRDMEKLFVPVSYSYNQLKRAMEPGSHENIDLYASSILQYAAMLSSTEKNHRTAELKLELFFLEKLYSLTSAIKSSMIKDFLRHIIDIFNIKNIYRNKFSGEKFNFDLFLHKNGFFNINFLKNFENENLEHFIQQISKTRYAPLIKQEAGLPHEAEDGVCSFEKSEELFYIYFFDPVKYTISNLEKIVDFFIKKRIELKNLSIVFTGILYDIDRSKIRHEVLLLDEDKNRSNRRK